VSSEADEPDSITAQPGHVIEVGREDGDRAGLAKRCFGHRRVDGVRVAVMRVVSAMK
jgi:hypothetical protein